MYTNKYLLQRFVYPLRSGFTIAEILIAISMIGFLTGLSGVGIKHQIDKGNDSKRKTDIKHGSCPDKVKTIGLRIADQV